MKELEIIATRGETPELCSSCKKVEETIVYLYVSPPRYQHNPFPEMVKIPLKPIEYCQCKEEAELDRNKDLQS